MSNVGKWAPWYERMTPDDAARMYSDTATYRMAAAHLAGLPVEDWGCGFATFKRHHRGEYTGVDGTAGWADVVDDLETRVSDTPGLLMRHVLEHNTGWRTILANACASASQRIALVVFTPDGEGQQIGWTEELGVPDLALPHAEIDRTLAAWAGRPVQRTRLATATGYGVETVWLAAR